MHYGYETLEADLKQLLPECRSYDPDTIVAIARGGLIAAQLLGYALNVRNIQVLRVASYDDKQPRDHVTLEGSVDLTGASRVLVVDDIVDSGKTLEAVVAFLRSANPAIAVRSAATWCKRDAAVQPDFCCREATEWIDFFWDTFDE